jgi:hypothetical protein
MVLQVLLSLTPPTSSVFVLYLRFDPFPRCAQQIGQRNAGVSGCDLNQCASAFFVLLPRPPHPFSFVPSHHRFQKYPILLLENCHET